MMNAKPVARRGHRAGQESCWGQALFLLKAVYVWLARKLASPEPDLGSLDTLASEEAEAGK